MKREKKGGGSRHKKETLNDSIMAPTAEYPPFFQHTGSLAHRHTGTHLANALRKLEKLDGEGVANGEAEILGKGQHAAAASLHLQIKLGKQVIDVVGGGAGLQGRSLGPLRPGLRRDLPW